MSEIVETPSSSNFLAQLRAIDADAQRLFREATRAELSHALPGRWSALQCVRHLTLTNEIYFPLVERALAYARARDMRAKAPFRYSWLERRIIRGTEPPARFRIPLPDSKVRPEPRSDVETVRGEYFVSHARVAQVIKESADIDLRRVRIKSPFIMRPSASLGMWFGILLAHERRHLYQAWRAVDGARKLV